MLNKQLTIVIPCKNEGINIYDCVGLIYKQKFVEGVRVIIADCSDDIESLNWLYRCIADFSDKLIIKIIDGGFPAKARLEGSKWVTTPYILFLDADIMLKERDVLIQSYENIFAFEKHLLTVPFQTEYGWNWAFRLFDITQWLSCAIGTPFAIGGFQLWNTKEYWKTGGYVETQKFAEDYWISSKCKKNKFLILRINGIWTSARRFKKKGIRYMIWLMIKSYINRNNPKFFDEDHNYWK
jgi:glycosyltransferase involved in cell wall biosynthesis